MVFLKKSTTLLMTLCIFCLCSCQTRTKQPADTYSIDLIESKKISLTLDEKTDVISLSIFQFEEDGKEYLSFGNFNKKQKELILFDLEKEAIHKRIPLDKESLNGVACVRGCKSLNGSQSFLSFQHNCFLLSIIDGEGKQIKQFSTAPRDNMFILSAAGQSYDWQPSFVIDSVLYFGAGLQPLEGSIKRHHWKEFPLFTSLDLRNGEIDWYMHYPSIFDQDVDNPAGGYEFTYDYNPKQNRLVCSFGLYDSLMVSDDLHHMKWVDGKSRYLKSMRPILPEAGLGPQTFIKFREMPRYTHIMYDKYRDVYYRFADHPCKLGFGESFMDEPKAREFSIIIFDKDLNIIGETKFPGNRYMNKMSFIGRDGLYISESNAANPDFNKNKLVFTCFKLENINQ